MYVSVKIKSLEKANDRIIKIKELIRAIEHELTNLHRDCDKADIEFSSGSDTEFASEADTE